MKKYRVLCWLWAVLLCWPVAAQAAPLRLRLMTYNVRHGLGLDNVMDLERTARVISSCQADVVAVQELDSVCTRSGKVYQLGELARLTGMHATFAGAISYQGGKYGVGILSKEVPLSHRQIALPGKEKRTLLVCEFEDYVYACTHLALEEENRLASLPLILEEVKHWNDKPFLMAGDWNDPPTTAFMQQLQQDFVLLNNGAEFTFPANAPTRCIDYIASYGEELKVTERKVVDEKVASDHRPLYVDAEIAEDESLLRYDLDTVGMTASVRAYSNVASRNAARYQGEITIPGEITVDGQVYRVTGIGESAFYKCDQLKAVRLPAQVLTVGKSAFMDCVQLESVAFAEGLESISNYAFANCRRLKALAFPSSLTTMGGFSCMGCDSLMNLCLPPCLEVLGVCAFQDCGQLRRVVLPSTLKRVRQQVFSNCVGLKTVIVPDGVERIDKNACANCPLDSIVMEASVPPVIAAGGWDKTNDCPIYVPFAAVQMYKEASNWAAYADRIVGYLLTAIRGVSAVDKQAAGMTYDATGKAVPPGQMAKGRLYIRHGRKFYYK